MRGKILWTLLGSLLFSVVGIAQQVQVIDKITKDPIENATIQEEVSDRGAITKADGFADITSFKKQGSIIVRHPSYKTRRVSYKELEKLNYRVSLIEAIYEMEDVVVSANKWEQNKIEIPQQITDFSREIIAKTEPATAADILSTNGEVFVQKSQLGGGSPMIRGFSANSILIVVDGVRMNNAIYRSGNLQNVITLDPSNLQGAEVVFGPGSVIYGSDALGGVMDFHTVTPSFSNEGAGFRSGGFARYASAANAITGNINLEINQKSFASYTSVTYSDFEDLRTGANRTDDFPDFGKRFDYAQRINGVDRLVQNDNVNRQVGSGYNQMNILQKFRWKINSFTDFTYGFHYSTSSDIPRYDRLIERRNGQLRNAEWYYGPQKWQMHHIQTRFFYPTKLFDQAKLTTAIQLVEESRNDRRFGDDRLRSRTEEVNVISVNADFERSLSYNNELFYGIEVVTNDVNSTATSTNIISNEVTPTSTRYPDGGSTYSTFAAYASSKINLSEKLIWSTGLRYSYTSLNSKFEDKTFFNFPFDEIELKNGSLNGSLGLVYLPTERLKFNASFSSGFRAPNVDDVGKVFDSEPGTVIVPNPELKPETTYNFEYGISGKVKNFNFGFTNYYTFLRDALVRRPFLFNGQPQIIYDGTLSNVFAEVNVGRAFIWGFNFHFNAELYKNINFRTNINYIDGEDSIENLPLRHISPAFGESGIDFKIKKLTSSIFTRYSAGFDFNELAPSEQNKTHLYTTDGALSWVTFNIRNSYQLNDYITVNFNLENILDTHYRPYSSGISAPGFNAIFSVRAQF